LIQAEEKDPCLIVYHDGSCPLCAREIAAMRSLTAGEAVSYVDVSASADGQIAADLTAKEAMARFHVRAADGTLLQGAAAFIALWSASPKLKWLAPIGRSRTAIRILDGVYNGFLKFRPSMQRLAHRVDRRSAGH
jgi:3-demethoxyubiquinol 3-hydroxylase